MKTKTITRSTILQAEKKEVFRRLRKLESLQYVATPYATFRPVDEKQSMQWNEGSTFSFDFYVFGWIPFGVHVVQVLTFDENLGISTSEHNKHVPVWNHRIFLESINEKTTRYTDEVEIGAGWKTPLVALWAKLFYRHRQRKWHSLLLKRD